MPVHHLGYEAMVPGNASRFFDSVEQACSQPTGWISVSSRNEDPFLFNSRFDQTSIRHDDSYCTSVVDLGRTVQVPTATYFEREVMPHLVPTAHIVDIGCGQGEFVDLLTQQGLQAVGYDPVLRRESSNLHRRYWHPDEPPADLYVMRCVLPHIEDPWEFLGQIAESSPAALVLIEFQQIDWVFRHSVWYQLSHDHVNLFRTTDFSERYRVMGQGTFANDEWAWVLVNPGVTLHRNPKPLDQYLEYQIAQLRARRDASLSALAKLDEPLAVWGAAGKGIVLAAALKDHAAGLVAIDADPLRWGKYLEHSGVRVLPPEPAMHELSEGTRVLVANPNHYRDIARYVNGRLRVAMPSDFGG